MLNVLTPPSSFPPASSYSRRSSESRAPSSQCRPSAYGQITPQEEDHRLNGKPSWMGPSLESFNGHGPVIGSNNVSGSQLDGSIDALPYKSSFYPQKHGSYHPTTVPVSGGPGPVQRPPAVPYQPSSPVKAPVFEALGTESEQTESGNQIVSYLQIPSSINNSKGSLSDFAAQITCLFWFESSYSLHRIEESPATPTPTTPLVEEAKPCMGFRKWVTTMLSTTQVTQNVILLALLFIYRLKKQNPQVKGKLGSEYRLLTVALMLGNKFLDDNTYTNKTWADVSGIAVSEIHVMEVEFLSNMRYNLYTSKTEWKQWHRKLGKFSAYFDWASKTPDVRPLAPPLAIPSPPQSQQPSPSFSTHDASIAHLSAMSSPTYTGNAVPAPITRMPDVDLRPNPRKRSYDDGLDQPQAKRVLRSNSAQPRPVHSRVPSNGSNISNASENTIPRLPVPMYSQVPYSQPMMVPMTQTGQLPPPPGRSMTMVYGNGQQQPLMPPMGGSPGVYQSGTNLTRLQIPPIYNGPRTRGTTPMAPGSVTGSPTNVSMTPNNELLSPAGFTIQRSSPYRPVRAVNTLLVPPPSGSFQNPPHHIPLSNMHYQPLGRPPSERRAGVVPFVHSDQGNWAHLSPFR